MNLLEDENPSTDAETTSNAKTALRCLACLPATLIWLVAGAGAARWLAQFDQLGFPPGDSGTALFLIWSAVVAGALLSLLVAAMTVRGKLRIWWQLPFLLLGVVALGAGLGN